MKKICGLLLFLLALPAAVLAHGNIWQDAWGEGVAPTKMQKLVVFPIEREGAAMDFGFEDSFLKESYNELFSRVKKRIKKTNFLGFAEELPEKQRLVREDDMGRLAQDFGSEAERAAAVYDVTGADGYMRTAILRDETREFTSPAAWTSVTLESYTTVSNSPNNPGHTVTVDRHSWTLSHLIPEMTGEVLWLDTAFTVYDAADGSEAITLIDYARSYKSHHSTFEEVAKNFAGDWKRLRESKPKKPEKNAPAVHIGELALPNGINTYDVKAICYAYKDEARLNLRHLKPDYEAAGRYEVTGEVTRYQEGEAWHAPYATVSSPSCVSRHTRTWRDKDGKEQTETVERYENRPSDVQDHMGYYSYYYGAGARLRLVDTETGETLIDKYYESTDGDRYANALRRIFGDFYRDAEELAKEMAKEKK